VTGDAGYRRLGHRESRQESLGHASSEVPRERDRELSASRHIGSREFEPECLVSRSAKGDRAKSR
jgi:hypothetical protein